MAIVMPNGILNNPGLTYIRHFLFARTQILAVVDMQCDLFQPQNDTQCSMVLLRRLAPAEGLKDYPVFMAIADKIGHDRRGKTIYKRNPDGTEVLERKIRDAVRIVAGKIEKYQVEAVEPVIDDELDDVAEEYVRWLSDRIQHLRGSRAI